MPSVAASFVATDKSCLQYIGTGCNFGTSDITLACSFKTSSVTPLQTIFASGSQGNGNDFLWLLLSDSQRLRFQFNDSSGAYIDYHLPSGTFQFAANTQYSLILSVDRDGFASITINGTTYQLVDVSGKSGSVDPGYLRIGAYTAGSFNFGGTVSHVRFWSRLLTPDEIARQANMTGGVHYARPYAQFSDDEKVGLVSSWELQEGPWSASQQALDSHGTNHLTFTAAAIINATTLNGGFETAGGGGEDQIASWGESRSGTSDVIRNTTAGVPSAGLACCELAIDSLNSVASIIQSGYTVGKTYELAFYAKAASGAPTLRSTLGDGANQTYSLTTLYQQFTRSSVMATGGYVQFRNQAAASNSILIDAIEFRAANLLTGAGPSTTVPSHAIFPIRRRFRNTLVRM